MIGNVIALLVLLALAVLFGGLTRRSWRSRRKILKWLGLILSGLLTLVFAFALVAGLIGLYKLNAPQNNPVPIVTVATTSEQIARGEKFALFCAGCHSSTSQPPLDGGAQSFTGPLGALYPPNLTPAGEIKDWSDGEIIRAIREGVHKNGRPLLVMPAEVFHNLSDADVQAIVAYLRSQPAIQHEPRVDTPSNGLNIFGTLLAGAGVLPTSAQSPITRPVVAPPTSTADYGKYLISVIGCRVCHGADLAGGTSSPFGGPPVGPNLTAIVPKWSEADFIKTIRTGADPAGHALSDQMPWKAISAFATDDDLKSIYAYLHALTPIDKSAKP